MPVVITGAFAGIAETGTLVMVSGPDHPVTLNLLPDTHIVVLREGDIVGGYEDVWARLRARYGKDAHAAHRQHHHRPVAHRRYRAGHGARRARPAAHAYRGGAGMSGGRRAPPPPRKGELRVVGTSVTREVELLLDRLAALSASARRGCCRSDRAPLVSDRNERNWRALIAKRFGERAKFVGIDLLDGPNVDLVLDICCHPRTLRARLGEEPFDLVLCCHVLEHRPHPGRAARNIERALRPGGCTYIATPWSQAFHAAPDDYWRFSVRGLMQLFGRLEIQSAFYSGGDVGLDVAYRVERDGKPELESRAGAVEQGLFQLVLDHEDNRDVLARQATERLAGVADLYADSVRQPGRPAGGVVFRLASHKRKERAFARSFRFACRNRD